MVSTDSIDSYYTRTAAPLPERPPLSGMLETEIAVIGGGLAGLSAAISLLERGHGDVTVLEARSVGWGASGRNAGSVTPGFSLPPWDVDALVGRDHGRRLFELSRGAVKLVRARIDRYQIPCAPVESGLLKAWWTPDIDRARWEQQYLQEVLDFPCELWPAERTRQELMSPRYHHALATSEAFQIHPLEYARGLARVITQKGGRIYEHTSVRGIEQRDGRVVIRTSDGEVHARRVFCACGGYIAGILREVSRAVLPLATHMMVTAPLGEHLEQAVRTRYSVFDSRLDHDYYRLLEGGRLLFGGGVSIRREPPGRVVERLQRRLLTVFPQLAGTLQIETAWSGLMDYSRHQMPMLGELRPGIWYSAGHGGHGLATTALFGELFARAVVDGDDTWRLLAPFRPEWAGGIAGLAAAQLTYWYYRGLDGWANWRAVQA